MLRAVFAAYRAAFAGLPRPVWILAITSFVNRSGTMVLPFLALYLTRERGFSPETAGQFLGLYGFGAMMGALLGGWLADRFSAKVIVSGALFGGGLLFLVLGRVEEPAAIGLVLVVTGTVMESFRPASLSCIAAVSPPDRRVRAFALNRLAANLGVAVGPAVGGFVAVYDYSWLFILDGSTCIAAALTLLIVLRLPPRRARTDPGMPTKSPFSDRLFLCFLGILVAFALVCFQLDSTYPLYLEHHYGLLEDSIGLLFTVNTLMIVAMEMLITKRLESVRPFRAMAVGMFLFAFGFALLPYGTTLAFVIFTVVIWTFGEMISMPLMAAWVSERAGEENRGRFMGLYSITFSSGYVMAPMVGTQIYQRISPDAVWHFTLVMGVIVTGLMLLLDRAVSR